MSFLVADLSKQAKLHPDEPATVAAGKLFAHLWTVAWKHAAAAGAGDVEGVHDMRVAIRRLRSALQNFEGDKNNPLIDKRTRREFAAQRRRIGKLGDLLGAVRDGDVLDEYLNAYSREHLECELSNSPGLARFERVLQSDRAAAFAPMVKALERAQRPGGIREEFSRWSLGLPALLAPPLSLDDAIHIVIAERLLDVREHAGVLADGADSEGHHELRKALRRLRYALEACGVRIETSPGTILKSLIDIQDILGEMQDRNVLRAAALAALGENDTSKLEPDIQAFLSWGEIRRRRLLGQARQWWRAHEAAGFFDRIGALPRNRAHPG